MEKLLEFDLDYFVKNLVNLDGRYLQVILFGVGKRMCLSYNLRFYMIQFAIASFTHAFYWSLVDSFVLGVGD